MMPVRDWDKLRRYGRAKKQGYDPIDLNEKSVYVSRQKWRRRRRKWKRRS